MAFNVVLIDQHELGPHVLLGHMGHMKVLDILICVSAPSGSCLNDSSSTHILRSPQLLPQIVIVTKEEKLRRMRRGWARYQLPRIVPPVVPIRYRAKGSSQNIGCWNFRKRGVK